MSEFLYATKAEDLRWRPIETAPRVARQCILGYGWDWRDGQKVRMPVVTFWFGPIKGFLGHPTHWMPFPALPDEDVG